MTPTSLWLLSKVLASCSSGWCCCCWGSAAGSAAPWHWSRAFWWEKCPLPSSSSCSSGWWSHNRLGAAWSCCWHSLSWSSYSTCFWPTPEALRRKSDISCSFPLHRPWVCSTAEQWERTQRSHSRGAGRCDGGLGAAGEGAALSRAVLTPLAGLRCEALMKQGSPFLLSCLTPP